MFKKKEKKAKRCKACYNILTDENKNIGVCGDCAGKEVKKIKRRIIISSIIGIIFIVAVFSALHHARVNTIFSSDGNIAYVPVLKTYWAFNFPVYESITNLSLQKIFIIALKCFFLPFGSFVKIDFFSPRHEAEKNIQNYEAQTAKSMSTQGYNKLDDIGLFLFSLFLLLISGPFFFVYRLYKLRQISAYIKTFEISR